MKKGYTHVTVILDRTGSMEAVRDDTIGGFNAFLDEQKKLKGKATLTLVQFDSQDPYEVICRFAPVGDVDPLTRETYVPRASTPLLDAMGRGINDAEKGIKDLPKPQRPERVVFVVVTDGQENASREFTKTQVEKMVKEKQEKKRPWQFVFLGADMGGINEARRLGLSSDRVLKMSRSQAGTEGSWGVLACRVSELRSDERDEIQFDEADRRKADQP